jgi:hypothetical protein
MLAIVSEGFFDALVVEAASSARILLRSLETRINWTPVRINATVAAIAYQLTPRRRGVTSTGIRIGRAGVTLLVSAVTGLVPSGVMR